MRFRQGNFIALDSDEIMEDNGPINRTITRGVKDYGEDKKSS